MDASSWKEAEDSLKSQGKADYTDGDIVTERHRLNDLMAKKQADDLKAAADLAAQELSAVEPDVASGVVEAEPDGSFMDWLKSR